MSKESICCSLRPMREKVAEGRMRGFIPFRHAEFISASSCYLKGFTLIELLVVVMIIAILAAIAVPQYKHAALKSRFSTVMPMAKAIADAQEVYYQGRHLYALSTDELDVTPVNAENTSVALSQTDGYDYVMAQNSRVPGANYIIYQKYSENYPSEIHCEAADDNEDAQWLCGALSQNNSIGKTITDGYTTYVINGTGAGIAVGAGNDTTNESGQTVVSCTAAEAMGLSCNITTNEAGQQVKQICTNGFCRTKTYNEDGSYTSVTCTVDSNGVCTANWQSSTYDEKGNQLTTRYCNNGQIDSSGNCTAYSSGGNYTYDTNGNMLTGRYCNNFDSNGNCAWYSGSSSYDYTYDANGNKLTERNCSSIDSNGNCTAYSNGYNYTYDVNGNMLTVRYCSVDSSGNCTADSYGLNYTYDANGNQLTRRECYSFDSSENCTAYSKGYNYTYDANGNKLTQQACSSVDSNGNCTAYSVGYSYDYTYDINGNVLREWQCGTRDSDGNCASSYGTGRNYTYDANGNKLSSLYCSVMDSNGNCKIYGTDSSYTYTYDANGNQLTERQCRNVDSDGNCTAYSGISYVYTYDDVGKQIATQRCSYSNLNTATGECIAYDSNTNVYNN